ncbi:MAG TPA: septation protein SepH [Acidimicrobiales bacterium]|nr:septation protein SepH [Acidimicrobiales bacterium]
MHDLQLVGFTTDRRGLIFRTRAGSRPEASFVVPITDELVELVTQLADGDTLPTGESDVADGPGEDTDVVAPETEPDPRPRSQMSVRDIQARLRAGEPTSRIAAEAGVEEDWIERFAPPVRAEQQRIVAQALDCHLQRARSAPSAVPLRRAVGMALADKGIAYTVAAYEAAWSARLLGHDRWAVSFTYHHRGRERVATWTYEAGEGALTTADRTAAQLGYVAPGRAADDAGDAVDGIVGDPAATATRTTTPETPTPEPATTTARTSTGKKATAEKAPARKAAAKQTATKKKATKKKAAKKAATKKQAARKAATKRKAAQKAATGKAPAKKVASKKQAAAKKAPTAKPAPPEAQRPKEKVVVKTTGTRPPEPAPAERTPPPPTTGDVDVPSDHRLPDEPPRPADVPVAVPPVVDRTPAPQSNGRPHPDASPSGPGRRAAPEADEVDPASARRERAAQRTASTVHFRSGSAAPVRVAPEPQPSRPAGDRPAADDRPRPERGETNGAARPATRRRRQLRAR